VSVAAAVGLDPTAAAAFLASGVGHREVQAMYRRVTAAGVNSIPTFVVDGGKFVVSGAAKAAELEECLRAIEVEVRRVGASCTVNTFACTLFWLRQVC
jgi:predicted DsbA family dithiol-disulfide isomerase